MDNGFGRDYYNAALCAMYSGKSKKTAYYLKQIALKGMSLDFFQDSLFSTLYYTKAWKRFSKELPEYNATFRKRPQVDLLNKLERLRALDQEFRVKEGSYELYRDTINKMDAMVMDSLEQIIRLYGYPSEDQIGINPHFDEMPAWVAFIHHAHQATWENLPEEFVLRDIYGWAFKACAEGKLAPVSAAYLCDLMNQATNYNGLGVVRLIVDDQKQDGLFVDMVSFNKDELNKRRYTIGLEPQADFLKKVQFIYCNPDTPFKLNALKNIKTISIDTDSAKNYEGFSFKISQEGCGNTPP
ncbi:MAG: hypothetical protein R2792_04555 [Saprospiraceae bacterium]